MIQQDSHDPRVVLFACHMQRRVMVLAAANVDLGASGQQLLDNFVEAFLNSVP